MKPEDKGQKPHHYALQLVQPFGLRLNLSTNAPELVKTSTFNQAGSSSLFISLIFYSPCFYRRNYFLKWNLFTPAEIPSRRQFGELPALFRIGYVTVYTFCCKLAPSALVCVIFTYPLADRTSHQSFVRRARFCQPREPPAETIIKNGLQQWAF